MKKLFLLVLFLLSVLLIRGQPGITDLSYPASVPLFQKYEISFKLGQYSNPYEPDTISVYAVFTGPGNRCDTVIGFYYEGYSFYKDIIEGYEHAVRDTTLNGTGWRIRFTPDTVGAWRFQIHAIDQAGETIVPNTKARPYTFNCISVTSAHGFISKANKRFLKRDIVKNGIRQYHSFFPVGPNIAWYSYKPGRGWNKPFGIYDYERYIDSLSGNGNYMRLWINRYQYLSLYGPEFTNTPPVVYFDSTINQKDSAELDYIINYASEHNIAIMLCFFTSGDFNNNSDPPSIWYNNPFNTKLHLSTPCEFFSDINAKKITKNLIRYIISRWGYATNIMGWELWNEVSNMFNACDDGTGLLQQNVLNWHVEMANYLRDIDPFKHCITTSMGDCHNNNYVLYTSLYDCLDFVQQHNYQNIQKAASREQVSKILLDTAVEAHIDYPLLPFFMGEYGFGISSDSLVSVNKKDPKGVELHNSLWSSLFSTSMGPASRWLWSYIDNKGLYGRFRPIMTFCNNLPILSDSFEAYSTGVASGLQLVFENNIETYYMKNNTEDTIFGWCQDTAFAYQSLRWLTDSVRTTTDPTGYAWHFVNNAVLDPMGYIYTLDLMKRPEPSSNSNVVKIPITNKPIGSSYNLIWFNSETGLAYNYGTVNISVQQDGNGQKYLPISFPSHIRNLKYRQINNTFGDAVFKIFYNGSNGGIIKEN